ncbi:hypothetical protein ACHAW5_000243 [Stephanodiscus triporus]|uniref:Sulfotransferase domain-containing protein n=1 Tax=Stephanodiscus triporus TaxID=2934178 RepID=A0ABD3NBB6_9STRA
MTGGLLPKLVILAAAAVLLNQLRRLFATMTTNEMNDERAQYVYDVEFFPITLSDRNTNLTNREEENDDDDEEDWKPLPWSLPSIQKSAPQKSSVDFMSELDELKRSLNISLPWYDRSLLPTPIISLNLPKTATTTMSVYFRCGGFNSAHTYSSGSNRIGECMRDNLLSDAPPFRGCDTTREGKRIQFYSDIGTVEPRCFYSSLHDGGLEHIFKFYPRATIFMVHRKFEDWYESVSKWGRGRLFHKWRNACGFAGPHSDVLNSTDKRCTQEDVTCWRSFYNAHTEKIRRFAIDHPSLTYLELQLDETTPSALELYTGISLECFQDCHPGKPTDPNVDLKTYKKCKPISTAR